MITPPVHIRLYREPHKPETEDDFVAVYDLNVLLGLSDWKDICLETSGCYFRTSMGCQFLPSEHQPPHQNVSCDDVLGNDKKPAIFILRSEYEKRLLSG